MGPKPNGWPASPSPRFVLFVRPPAEHVASSSPRHEVWSSPWSTDSPASWVAPRRPPAAPGLWPPLRAPVAAALGAGPGASGLDLVSGTALALLGWRGSPAAQRVGVPGAGGVNLAAGVLGLMGLDRVAGLALNASILGDVISIGIGIGGLGAALGARRA